MAKRHCHKKTTEFYYVLNGRGILDLELGTSMMICPGTRHRAEGQVEALIVGIPPFDPADMFVD
ncbi:MAG TPA: hypothetical protein EYP17_04970 [Candidatus Latescibacteria bacterium]|nr:hypothetical protein [Candidatus Latescibacterota bacterium]